MLFVSHISTYMDNERKHCLSQRTKQSRYEESSIIRKKKRKQKSEEEGKD